MADSTLPEPQIDPEFRQRRDNIYQQWRDGKVPFEQALDEMKSLEEEARQAQEWVHVGFIESTMGIMHGYRGNYDQSLTHFDTARALYEKANTRRRVAGAVLNMGESYRLKGNFSRARTFFHTAYEIGTELKTLSTQAIALGNEGQMWFTLGSVERAQTTLEQALKVNEAWLNEADDDDSQHSAKDNACEIHHALVQVYLQQNERERASEHARQALTLAQDLQTPLRLGYAYRALGEVTTVLEASELDEGVHPEPDEHYKQALRAFREVAAEGEVAKTLYAQATSLARRGKRHSAARTFQKAMTMFTRLGMNDDAAKAAAAQLEALT